jgi:hypothetical protein
VPCTVAGAELDSSKPGDALPGDRGEADLIAFVETLSAKTSVAELALIIHGEAPKSEERRLSRVLTFFGVPWQSVKAAELRLGAPSAHKERGYVVFGSASSILAALRIPDSAAALRNAAAVYVYPEHDLPASARALSEMTGCGWAIQSRQEGPVSLEVTSRYPELTGPMSGLALSVERLAGDLLLPGEPVSRFKGMAPSIATTEMLPIVSVDGRAAFFTFRSEDVPWYVCTNAPMIDIDQPVARHYYDVKDQFLQAVPLVMFVMWVFRPVMWRPRETGACLIIDDPLLKERYGSCDFVRLRDAMRQYGFTTNIAFIPWNWRRTGGRGGEFFRRESELFSVSIHGCDHVKAEFGRTSAEYLCYATELAQSRMNKHERRTDIHHERVMVFPQGVFSSICPGILKRNGFLAAVNTEIAPVDAGGRTLVRDVWDSAILRYGSFAIYTRRYEHHGLENFAFDLLLGKPSFIVAHHDSFRDQGARLLQLVIDLSRLQPGLRWRSPAEVIRRSYRWRTVDGVDEYQMYAAELMAPRAPVANRPRIRKIENDSKSVAEVLSSGKPIPWRSDSQYVRFDPELSETGETLVSLQYRKDTVARRRPDMVRNAVGVAARRFLCEIRDELIERIRAGRAGL